MFGEVTSLLAQATTLPANPGSGSGSGMAFWIGALAILSLAPFVLMVLTCFAKLTIVFGLLRQALGTQHTPPNAVVTGLSLLLSMHVMAPVGREIGARHRHAPIDTSAAPAELSRQIADVVHEPVQRFLRRHASPSYVALFERLSTQLDPSSGPRGDLERTAIVLAPAFILSELTHAFQIGFLIFVPFLVIDLVVSNVLLAMGMQSLTPATVSLPLKLLLFVLVDGWRLLAQGLLMSYATVAGGA